MAFRNYIEEDFSIFRMEFFHSVCTSSLIIHFVRCSVNNASQKKTNDEIRWIRQKTWWKIYELWSEFGKDVRIFWNARNQDLSRYSCHSICKNDSNIWVEKHACEKELSEVRRTIRNSMKITTNTIRCIWVQRPNSLFCHFSFDHYSIVFIVPVLWYTHQNIGSRVEKHQNHLCFHAYLKPVDWHSKFANQIHSNT